MYPIQNKTSADTFYTSLRPEGPVPVKPTDFIGVQFGEGARAYLQAVAVPKGRPRYDHLFSVAPVIGINRQQYGIWDYGLHYRNFSILLYRLIESDPRPAFVFEDERALARWLAEPASLNRSKVFASPLKYCVHLGLPDND